MPENMPNTLMGMSDERALAKKATEVVTDVTAIALKALRQSYAIRLLVVSMISGARCSDCLHAS